MEKTCCHSPIEWEGCLIRTSRFQEHSKNFSEIRDSYLISFPNNFSQILKTLEFSDAKFLSKMFFYKNSWGFFIFHKIPITHTLWIKSIRSLKWFLFVIQWISWQCTIKSQLDWLKMPGDLKSRDPCFDELINTYWNIFYFVCKLRVDFTSKWQKILSEWISRCHRLRSQTVTSFQTLFRTLE